MNDLVLELNGLDCAGCAGEIEKQTQNLEFVENASLDFVTKKLRVDLNDLNKSDYIEIKINEIVNTLEPGVKIEILKKPIANNIVLELEDLNCAGCAGEIEEYTKKLENVLSANLNFVNKKLDINISNMDKKDEIVKKVTKKTNELEPNVKVIDLNKDSKDFTLILEKLDCAGCAADIEEYSKNLEEIEKAELNFVTKKLNITLKDPLTKYEVILKLTKKINELEPGVIVSEVKKANKNKEVNKVILELNNLDCAGCAADIEEYTKSLEVSDVVLNFVNKKLEFTVVDIAKREEIIGLIKKKVGELEPGVTVIEIGTTNKNKHTEEIVDNSNKDLLKIIASGVLFLIPVLFKLEGISRFILFFISYLIVGMDVIKTALKNIKAKNPMDEHFLMMVATVGAFIIGEYPEGVAVMLFYQLGEYFQGRAVNHSRRSIKALMDIRPDYANLVVGEEIKVLDPEDIEIGDLILIRPGEKVPLDGVVISGNSTLDTSNITGESVPVSIKPGDDIISGVVNNNGVLKVRVTKGFGQSTINKILDLVENASSKKAPTENFISKFSKYYTPVVVYIALAVAILPPLFLGQNLSEWFYRAFVFLVVSCPCAIVISVPLGFFGGIGASSKEGVLVKGSNYLEALKDVDTIVFDKTGTITKGVFKVTSIKSYSSYSEEEILEIAAYGETYSNHPIASSIKDEYGKQIETKDIKNYKEIAGKGISVDIKEKHILLGNKSLMDLEGIKIKEEDSIGTVVYIGEDKKHIGTVVVSDELKEGIKETIKELKNVGINKTIMLSGDNEKTVLKVAEKAGISKAYGNLLPQDKVELFEKILKDNKDGGKVAFVGDGVNDAPVLARADVGIAMGGLGSDAAIEASDIVIMTDEIHKIVVGKKIAKKTNRIVKQNIIFALGVKLLVLVLGLFGKASMWQAVFADVGVSIIAIFNSIRALKVDK